MADKFNSILKEGTFIQTEADSIFCKSNANAFKVNEEECLGTAVENNIVNDRLAVDNDAVRSEVYFLKGNNEERDIME